MGWDVDKIVRKAVRSRDRVLARINGPAVGFDPGIIHRGKNSFSVSPYRPAFLDVLLLQRPERVRTALCVEAVGLHDGMKSLKSTSLKSD